MFNLYYTIKKPNFYKRTKYMLNENYNEPLWFKIKNESDIDIIFYCVKGQHLDFNDFYNKIQIEDNHENIDYTVYCNFEVVYEKIILKPNEKMKIKYRYPLYVQTQNNKLFRIITKPFNKLIFNYKLNKKYIKQIEKENEKFKYGKYD
jgi:hypothetical protein